jgi:hypothetical protein
MSILAIVLLAYQSPSNTVFLRLTDRTCMMCKNVLDDCRDQSSHVDYLYSPNISGL